MSKDINKSLYDEATLTKLDLLEQYLVEWLPVFIKSKSPRIMIWDFFAGSGQDAEGNPGSPLRILRAIEKHRDNILKGKTSIEIMLNDSNKEKFETLNGTVSSKFDKNRWANKLSISCFKEKFEDIFCQKYAVLKSQPNFLFIDQYGIRAVSDDIFEKLLDLNKTDFLFFISSSLMKRFATEPGFKKYFPGLDIEKIKNEKLENIHRLMLDHYKQKIPVKNECRLYPFTLKKGGNDANIYGLIFGTKHPLGADKFLHLAWKENDINGEANFDIDNDIFKQTQLVLPSFEKKPTKIEVFKDELEGFIKTKRKLTNCDIYYFTLEHGHLSSHAKEFIARLKKADKVKYDERIGISYESCVKDKNIKIIEWLVQE